MAWQCKNCDETADDHFEACWRCGASRTGEIDPAFENVERVEQGPTPPPATDERVANRGPSISRVAIRLLLLLLGLVAVGLPVQAAIGSDTLRIAVEGAIVVVVFLLLVCLLAAIASVVTRKKDAVLNESVPLSTEDAHHIATAADAAHDEDIRERVVVCPHCLTPNSRYEHFCENCGTPLTSHAATDPFGQIFAAGNTYQKAAERPAGKLTLIAVWLIFGPQIPFLLIGIVSTLSRFFTSQSDPVLTTIGPAGALQENAAQVDAASVLTLVVMIGLLWLYSAILLKATRSYRRTPNPLPSEP